MDEHVYWRFVAGLAAAESAGPAWGPGYRPRSERHKEIVAFVHDSAIAGESWAQGTLARWAREGAERDYGSEVDDSG